MRRAALVFAAFVASVVGAFAPIPAHAAPTCNDAAARSAIRYAKPRLAPFGDPVVVPAKAAGQVLCLDETGDGLIDMAVTWFSGGTAGDIGWMFFVGKPDGWKLGGSGTGYKLYLREAGTTFEVIQPVYRKNDANCCPTGGLDHMIYAWKGGKLVRHLSFHTKGPG